MLEDVIHCLMVFRQQLALVVCCLLQAKRWLAVTPHMNVQHKIYVTCKLVAAQPDTESQVCQATQSDIKGSQVLQ